MASAAFEPPARCRLYSWCTQGPGHADEHASAVHVIDLRDGREALAYLTTAGQQVPRLHIETHRRGCCEVSGEAPSWVLDGLPVNVVLAVAERLAELARAAM